jgi:hypothetical protein
VGDGFDERAGGTSVFDSASRFDWFLAGTGASVARDTRSPASRLGAGAAATGGRWSADRGVSAEGMAAAESITRTGMVSARCAGQ